jgi:hypothetical protein
VQDLHLVDAAASPITEVLDEPDEVDQTIDLTEPEDVTTST